MDHMALAQILKPPKRMELACSESTKDEGYSPGLRLFQGSTPNQSILLNATYNNYTITNHYRSKEQYENNDLLRKENRALKKDIAMCTKKYKAAKQLLREAAELVKHVPIEVVDYETGIGLMTFSAKIEKLTTKRKPEEADPILPSKRSKYQ